MVKQIVVHPYDGKLLSKTEEGTFDIHNYLDQSLENYAEYKKAISKFFLLYYPIYITFFKKIFFEV